MQLMTFLGPTFTMEIPTNWFVAASAQYQAIFTDPHIDDGFQSNMVVSIRTVQENVGTLDVAASAKETQRAEYPAYEIMDETVRQTTPVTVKRVYRWHHPEQKKDIVQMQFFLIHKNRLYTLTGTRLAETKDAQVVDKVLHHMIDSFELNS